MPDVTDTSLSAYEKAKSSLGKHQALILRYLQDHPGSCNLEIADALKWPINKITPRVLELRAMNLVTYAGRKISRTGLLVKTWKANDWNYRPKVLNQPRPARKKFTGQLDLPILSD